MPLDITFTLSDADLDHFQAIVDKAKSAMKRDETAANIEAAARRLISEAKSADLPGFIDERLSKLEVIIDMVRDEEWKLSDEERRRVLGALVNFCDPEDLIPDHIPGLGFLDDAIYVELVIRGLRAEIDSYEEFVQFRAAEEKRRVEKGLDTRVGREEWLADKRAALHTKMRKRRRASMSGNKGWHLISW